MALPEPVRRGQVHPKDYQNEEYYGKLGPLITALHEEAPDAKYDAKSLVVMLVQILHFQEAALGKDAMPPRVCPKLPIKLITDPSVGGALHAIALKVYDIKRQRNLKAIEWQNPGKRKECLEILLTLRRELERRQLLRVPLVHVSPSLGPETQRLREYVRRLQANLAESPDEQGVTHVVYPFGPGGEPDDGNEYTTVVEIKGSKARVHYWYQPDSYDEWIPLASLENKEVSPDKAPPGGKWKVTPRWVVDSEKYNEWMNPADYTTPDFDAEMEAAEAAGGKEGKRAAGAQGGTAKKQKTEARTEVAVEPLSVLDVHVVTRRLLTHPKGLTDPRGISTDNLSQGQTNIHLASYVPALPPAAPHTQPDEGATAAAANGVPPAAAGSGYSAPACVGWFRYDAIHDNEKLFCPDFFNGRSSTKTPEVFKRVRDAIIALHLQHPERALRFADVREHIQGEVTGMQRIFDMLESWGLINHAAHPDNATATLKRSQQALQLGSRVTTGMPPGNACLYDFKAPSKLEASAALQQGGVFHAGQHAQGSAAAAAPGSLLTPAHGRRSADVGLRPSVTQRIYCSAMPWVDCTSLRYHCTKHPDINLCPAAFAEGRFPPGCSSRDFVRLGVGSSSSSTSADGWRPEETLLLLEGLELYKEDWEKVAAHVGTKSQAACLTHFVRLPIEDQFIDDLVTWGQQQQQGGGASSSAPAAVAGLPDGMVLPFQDEHNPVMATVCMLAVLMGPRVAAAAAQRALQVIAEGDMAAARDLAVAARIAAGPPPSVAAAAAADGANGAAESREQAAADGADGGGAASLAVDPSRKVEKPLLVAAAAAGLAAAAARAKLLANQEEREIQRLMVMIVDAQMRKVDKKVKLLADMTQVVDRERVLAESAIKQLTQEYPALVEQRKKAEAAKEARQQQQQAVAKKKAELAQKQKADAAAAAAKHQQQAAQQQAASAAQQQIKQEQVKQELGPMAQQRPQQQMQPTQQPLSMMQQQLLQHQQMVKQQQVVPPPQQQKQQVVQQQPGQLGTTNLAAQPPQQAQAAALLMQRRQQQQQNNADDDDDFDMP